LGSTQRRLDCGPRRRPRQYGRDAHGRCRLLLRAEQKTMRHHAFQVHEHVQAVVHKVRDPQLFAVLAQVEPHKQRYSIVGDWVRANYGHSTADRIAHTPMQPPDVLVHGTSTSAVASILREGLLPMQRQFVHLTPDRHLASTVAMRHGKACLIRVDARGAHADGVIFYQANHTFWLVDRLEPRYLLLEPGTG
jgi:putative RNA 2'-phosphotransferase